MYPHKLDGVAVGQGTLFHFQHREGRQEFVQALAAKVTHIKVRVALDELVSHAGGSHPAGAIVHLVDHIADQAADGIAVDGGIVPRANLGGGFGGSGGIRAGILASTMLQNQVKVLELVAGFHKGTKCLAFAHADDQLAGFAQAGGKAGKVRIGRNDAKAIHIARIQQIHGVNDHGAVGCIFAGWLSDILAVNGFDERMQYGGQDREFGERLENYGIHGMQIRYSTVCLHLDHARGYKTKDSIQKNRNIRKHTRGAKVQWASLGIVKDELRGQSVKVNSYYDRYTREEEKLTSYKEKGGFYRHIYSLPCRWRRAKYHDKVVRAYQQDTDAPTLSNHSGVIVSLTTFPPRISQLHLMLKSILWQTCPPEKIIVWLSEQEFPGRLNDLPEELRRLMAKGIEFRFVSENFRSHKKYHYVFREYPDSKVITVDDDLIYPRNTVERLLSLSYQYPDTVCGNVIRKIHMDGNSFSVYRKWTKVFTMPVNSSLQNVAIGCGGIYYPPHWYGEELFDWKIISEHCPSADDLWLKANELKRRVKVTGGGGFYPRPIELPQTQNNSLQKKNNGKTNLNDKQWKSLNELWKLDELYCINGK